MVVVVVGLPSAASAQSCQPLACSEILVDLPYQLDFGGDHGKIVDANGIGTGFTYVDPPTNATGYIPENLLIDTTSPGVFQITTTSGEAFGTENSQDNAVGVGVDAPSQVTRVHTTLSDPPSGTNHQQAGLWFGNDEDNFVKLSFLSQPSGATVVVFEMEVNGVLSGRENSPALDLAGHSLGLDLIADPTTQRIEGLYQVDAGPTTTLGWFDAPGEFFSFDAARIDPEIGTDTFTGIYASHVNGPAPLDYSFDDFSVLKERDLSGTPLDEGIAFERSSFPLAQPTSMAFGPDGRLYVTELFGTIHALTLSPQHEVVEDEVITTLGTRLTLGLTVDPQSTPEDVVLWASHSNPAIFSGTPNSSVVSRLSGPGFTEKEDVITGLPRAIANHATNSIHFGPDGRLYLAQGGNTNAGAPSSDGSEEFGDMQEQPLSAALLVADVRDAGFDGSCNNPDDIFGPPPCDVTTYATGLRNTYDFVFHSNGSIYGPTNGAGVNATFPPSPSPPCFGLGDPDPWDADPPGNDPGPQHDPLFRIQEGKYYGHPNPSRGECVFGDGGRQGVGPPANLEPSILDLGDHRSANGTIEYEAASPHCGALEHELVISNLSIGDDLTRVELSDDGTSVLRAGGLAAGFDDPLPLAQDSDGTIYVGEFGADKVTALSPINLGCWTERAPQPVPTLDAGGAALGGKLYAVGGETDEGQGSSLHIYDPAADAWSQGPDLPGPGVENPAAVAHQGKLYVFGGSTDSFSGAVSDAAVYDPLDKSWATLPDLPIPRGQAAAQSLGGKIYLVGGLGTDGASLESVDVFDPSSGVDGSWSSAAPMSMPRDNPGAAVLSGKLYVFGGGLRAVDGYVDRRLASVEMYDPATDSWAPRAPMPTGRQAMAVGTLNGRAQLIGGEVSATATGTFSENEEYDPITDGWRALTSERTPRHGAATGTIGNAVYVAGGGTEAGFSVTAVNEAFSFVPLEPAPPPPPPNTHTFRCRGKVATLVGSMAPETLRGGRRADVIVARGGADRIKGRGGADLICAGRGNDAVRGGFGPDVLLGGLGRDRLLGGRGRDACAGGRGRDTRRGCEMSPG